jgi:hypothetical protein
MQKGEKGEKRAHFPLKKWLQKMQNHGILAVATKGGMSHGQVLPDLQQGPDDRQPR